MVISVVCIIQFYFNSDCMLAGCELGNQEQVFKLNVELILCVFQCILILILHHTIEDHAYD